jgi:hypothetical protein
MSEGAAVHACSNFEAAHSGTLKHLKHSCCASRAIYSALNANDGKSDQAATSFAVSEGNRNSRISRVIPTQESIRKT